jgi:hypothetical protein
MTELVRAVERLEAVAAQARAASCWMGIYYGRPHALGTHPDCLMCEAKRKEQA